MCVSFYVSVLDNSAIAEPLTVRLLVEFVFIFVNKTPSVCKVNGSSQRDTSFVFQGTEGFQKVLKEDIRKIGLIFCFFSHSIK